MAPASISAAVEHRAERIMSMARFRRVAPWRRALRQATVDGRAARGDRDADVRALVVELGQDSGSGQPGLSGVRRQGAGRGEGHPVADRAGANVQHAPKEIFPRYSGWSRSASRAGLSARNARSSCGISPVAFTNRTVALGAPDHPAFARLLVRASRHRRV
jgi:hypothetical protein